MEYRISKLRKRWNSTWNDVEFIFYQFSLENKVNVFITNMQL